MEIMEDGNLVDRVRILLQRDMEYYQEKQTVLREPLCIRVSGGKLDFPRHASFAAIKIVTWWEAEFISAFKRVSGLSSTCDKEASKDVSEGVIKNIQPKEFISLILDTSDQLLEHLHTLIQEALDHADLAVLTATLGAAALVRNCLWCYNQQVKDEVSLESSEKIYKCYKSYHEMAEALAERLLDLHCRLISLYILNEADSLSWHAAKSFFEKERCSFVIQMWWLYMQGTKADLWNTVPPKMAQRVFSGMLNESLSIITARFIHGRPSLARSEQFWADAFNVLCCTAYLTLNACMDGNEMAGLYPTKLSTVARDIHAKCDELLVCLLLRGTPLILLYQTFRDGLQNSIILQKRLGPAPWLVICAPHLLNYSSDSKSDVQSLPETQAVALELNVLKSQPQPNWPQLVKVLSMRDNSVAIMLLELFVRQCIGYTVKFEPNRSGHKMDSNEGCGGFLCIGSACNHSLVMSPSLGLYSLIYILANTTTDPLHIIIPALRQDPMWNTYLDRQQVWNQARPPWLNALLTPLHSIMLPIVETLLDAVKTGASIYQTMSLTLTCLTELFVCIPVGILRTAFAIDENIPAHCHPLGGSVLLQILCSSLYSVLLKVSESSKKDAEDSPKTAVEFNGEIGAFNPHDKSASAIALAEALCSIDEDNKHTSQIEILHNTIKESIELRDSSLCDTRLRNMSCVVETFADELLFTETGRRSLKVLYDYIVQASDWILASLKLTDNNIRTNFIASANFSKSTKTLPQIMFHIEDAAFDQLLTGSTNWEMILSQPLSTTIDRVRNQILIRPEFKDIGQLRQDEREAAILIKKLCSTVKSARIK
ncbi:uncharacterized protein LOC107265150 isoform X1 [Cephus cinctus]|uniref:Uncharacterized protein LOC107265150 isoform X1 n=1 Tax=Cephus cinctus TaxID=211228 RepID=A0AAJ7BMJ3_CEPCN|nr:uncharacterized protein LOC107265150 isoform X1 [Cephus cinctus]XP_015589760.1 uncharacterized protein LOC107265150 isoform X1 [Cephus cinctus]